MMDKVNEFSESLLQEKNYIEKLMGSMMEAIIVMDRELNILELNESACQMLGYTSEELISRPLTMLMEEETESLLRWLIKDHSIRNEEKKLIKKGGGIIYAFISLSLVEDNEDSYDRILCVAEDITGIKIAEELLRKSHDDMELKVHERTAALVELNKELEEEIAERNRAEASLMRMNEKLEISNRELQEFAFIASHDLQEPLRKITTFGDRLRVKCTEGLGEQGNDYLQRMQSAAGRMHDLISSLLMFSRVSSRARPFDRVDLNIVASEVLSDLEVRIEQTGGKVELSALETIEADSFQMHQVLQNLISNALKFSKKDVAPVVKVYGKFIRGNRNGLEATESGEMYQMIVEDNGIGFDEKYLEKIFGVFQRLHGRREYDGTGIGLSICRKILERHGGSITAESSLGNGASFIVTLPVHQTKQVVKTMNFAER
jgi:PAS domain S-box-containing protein